MKRKLFLVLAVFALAQTIASALPGHQAASAVIDSRKTVILGGETVGIKLYSDGLVCVDFEPEEGGNPALSAGLQKGDVLLLAFGKPLSDTDVFAAIVAEAEGAIPVTFERGGTLWETTITPKVDETGKKRVGLWVRDSVGGIGTVTFYNPEDNQMVTLGHAVTDADTGYQYKVQRGYITDCEVLSVRKSEQGTPGEVFGRFTEDEKIYGYITDNTGAGLFAAGSGLPLAEGEVCSVAGKNEVQNGTALLYTDLAGDGVKPYAVSIQRLYAGGRGDMLVTVEDERLKALTGGIVQGMSGSPLVQNGKIVGALTHVFVNDPTKGYGIFIENMLNEAEK